MLLFTVLSVPILAEKTTEEARLIRRAFLDIKRVPPTPEELTWYLCYNFNPYQTAIDWLLSSDSTMKPYFLSTKYKLSKPTKLDSNILELIIKYQAGNLNTTNEQADKMLVKISIACGEDNITDTIDYLSFCLIARVTNTSEINLLQKLFRTYTKEEDGYLAVLQELKQHKEFLFN